MYQFSEWVQTEEDRMEFSSRGVTQRERDVVLWVAQGKINQEIALILGVSPRTVSKHLEHIFHKFQVNSRVAVVGKVYDMYREPKGQPDGLQYIA
jgi:DNA-binding CsgD family transcriptional regulator